MKDYEAESDIVEAIAGVQVVSDSMKRISDKAILGQTDYEQLLKLVDKARQHLQVISANAGVLAGTRIDESSHYRSK